MGQTIAKLKNTAEKCFEVLPIFKYKRLSLEQTKIIQELEKLVLSQKTEIQLIKEENKVINLESQLRSKSYDLNVSEQLLEICNSIRNVNKQVDNIENHFATPKASINIGEDGENFVLQCLKEGFPFNTGIIRNEQKNNSGDILFRVENTDKLIMIEVKNLTNNRAVTSVNNGKDINKFFHDLHQSPTNFSGGILVSLNGPVDVNVPSKEPKFDGGKPYVYVDNLRQYPDPVCLLHVVITMMTFMMKYIESNQDHGMQFQLEAYSKQSDKMLKLYKELFKAHNSQKKSLDSLKDEIINMKTLLTTDVSKYSEKYSEKIEEGPQSP